MCWLLLALVLAPALGLVHQVVHAPGTSQHSVQVQVQLQGEQSTVKQAADVIHALFAGHSKAECVLLDQMALGHALLAKALPLLQALPFAVPVVDVSADPADQHAAPFHARGPPTWQTA